MTESISPLDPRLHASARAAAGDLWLSVARSGAVIAEIAHRGHANRSCEAYAAASRSAQHATTDTKEHN